MLHTPAGGMALPSVAFPNNSLPPSQQVGGPEELGLPEQVWFQLIRLRYIENLGFTKVQSRTFFLSLSDGPLKVWF